MNALSSPQREVPESEWRGFARDEARLLNAILDAMESDHIYVSDQEGRFVYISAPGARALGWNRTEKLGKTPLEAGISPAAVERGERERQRIFAGETVSGQMYYDLPDGRHEYEYTGSPIPGEDGQPRYALTRIWEVTERNRSRRREEEAWAALAAQQTETTRAAQEGEARLQTLAAAIPGFVWTAPQGGVSDWVNRRYWEYIGYPDTASIPDSFIASVHPEDVARANATWFHAQETGEICEYEVRIRGADGVYRWFLARSIPYREAGGVIRRWFGVTIDIEAQKRAQLELENVNARLKRAMAETHHRVKNNLQVIAGLLEWEAAHRAAPLPSEELSRFTQHIRALAAVHDLLTEDARHGGDSDLAQAKAILEKLLPMLRIIAGNKRIDAHLEDARITSAQGTSLALIVNELIHNAIKHGATCVGVRFLAEEGVAKLTISDDGPGFPPDFDPAHDAHTGLELVRHLSEWDLHGTVTFENHPEGGARVIVVLPIAPSPEKN